MNLKFVKVGQEVKLCVYGENLSSKIVHASSKLEIENETKEEVEQQPKTQEETEAVSENNEDELTQDLEDKLNIESESKPKETLVNLYDNFFFSIRLTKTQNSKF